MGTVSAALMTVAITLSTFSCVGPEPSGQEGSLSVDARSADGRCLHELSAEWKYYPEIFFVTGDDFANQAALCGSGAVLL